MNRDLEKMLQCDELEAAFIITPHVLHFAQGEGMSGGWAGRIAGKAHGDEREGGC